MKVGRAVPGFWRQPAGVSGKDWWRADNPRHWDWSRRQPALVAGCDHQAGEAADLRGLLQLAPTVHDGQRSGIGGGKGHRRQSAPRPEKAFADYLVRVTDELQRRHRITFRTLSPVNEPNTDYWFAANTQEGAHWSPPARRR